MAWRLLDVASESLEFTSGRHRPSEETEVINPREKEDTSAGEEKTLQNGLSSNQGTFRLEEIRHYVHKIEE